MTKKEISFALLKDRNLQTTDLASALKQYMLQYTVTTLKDRALPAIDGFKPVQRRLLYTMWNQHLINGKATKLNNVGGYTMLLHPHGDPSPFVYTLAANWLNNVSTVKVIGNGGTINKGIEDAAATRYTSGTLTDFGYHVLAGLSEKAVEMQPSYDGERMEPKLLPIEYPNALMNRNQGIGVAMTTNIYPHNPKEIIEALLYYIDHPKMSIKKLASIVKGPDFPTGGLLVGSTDANLTELKYGQKHGKQSLTYIVRGEAKLHTTSKGNFIQFVSIPYDTTIEAVMSSIATFVDKNPDLGIKQVLEQSTDYDSIDIRIVFDKNADKQSMEQVLALLYKHTKLQMSLHPFNLIIDNDGRPKAMGMLEYFDEWLKFRKACLTNEFNYELKQAQDRQEIVEGLIRLIDISDQVVKDAKASKNKTDFKKILMKKYDFTARQSEAIASMALYRLGRQDARRLAKENKELTAKIEKLNKLLSDDHAFMNELKARLRKLNRTLFKDCKRRTKLVEETKVDTIKVQKTQLIKKQNVVVVAKRNGSLQRMSQQVYENNVHDYQDVDQLVFVGKSNTQQGGLFFTKKGLAYFRFINDLENLNIKKDADSVSKVITSYKADDETIGGTTFDLPMKDLVVVVATKLGRVKVTDLSKVKPNTNTKRYLKNTTKYFGLKDDNDEVIFTKVMPAKDVKGITITINPTGRHRKKTVDLGKLSVQGASASGTQVVKLTGDDYIKDVKLESRDE